MPMIQKKGVTGRHLSPLVTYKFKLKSYVKCKQVVDKCYCGELTDEAISKSVDNKGVITCLSISGLIIKALSTACKDAIPRASFSSKIIEKFSNHKDF